MYKFVSFIFILSIHFSLQAQKEYDYPQTSKDSIYNTYFDTAIYDPYQWMENPNDPRLAEWLKGQEKINNKQSRKQARKTTLRAQLASMYNDVKKSTIDQNITKEKRKISKYEFDYYETSYKRAKDVRYRLRGQKFYRKLVHIKDFQKSRNNLAIVININVNEKTDIANVEISHYGGDWREYHFYNLKTGEKLPDIIHNVRIGSNLIWVKDGFYYDRYDKPKQGRELLDIAKGQTLCYHKFGGDQDKDIELYRNPDETGATSFTFFKKDTLLFLHYYKTIKNKTYRAIGYTPLSLEEAFNLNDFILYPNDEKINLSLRLLHGDTILIQSNWNTPNGNVLIANINQKNQLTELIPEYDIPLVEINNFGKDKIACIYRNEGKYVALIYNFKGELLKMLSFPEGKKLKYFKENNQKVNYTTFCLSSFYHPELWYQISLDDYKMKPIKKYTLPYNPFNIETRYVKYKSKDGTEIPMYITCLKKTKFNGKNPTLLYGYGGYGITVEPGFDKSIGLWLLHGGILATPNIRGGGAKGSSWSEEGRHLKKQNAIDDFIAAAEYLIDEKYTNPEKLGIMGASHGGMLVGAALTQRPELFKTAIIDAGALDLIRDSKYTVGGTSENLQEFGNISKEEDFKYILSYSPLNSIKKGVEYPNVLAITGDKDDRVPPFESYKFISTLQEKGSSKSLYQLYLVPGSGHGGALIYEAWEDLLLFRYYYLFDELDLKFW